MNIKQLFFLTALCLSSKTFGQHFQEVDLNYESRFYFDSVIFQPGDTTYFAQRCTDKLPAELVNHTVQMNHFHVNKLHFRFVVTFKDTVVQRTVYYYEGSAIDSALAVFGLQKEDFYQLDDEALLHYSARKGLRAITCWIDRKRLYYMEVLTH